MKKPILIMKNINPCIWFDGNAKEAATFYSGIFKETKINFESPMVVMFEVNGKSIMGLNGGPMFKVNPSISFFVLCETLEETKNVWDKLMAGGKAMIPMDKQIWSEMYGWVQDKFGVTWQIAINDKEKGKQTMTPSLLFVNEKFGKAEEALNFYTKVFENSGTDLLIHYPSGDSNSGKVMYSEFNLGGYKMIAMDGPGNHSYTFNEGVSFVVHCDSQKEIDYFWDTFTKDGGKESMCGWLKDKYGISWQIVPSMMGELMADPIKGGRVMKEVLKMKKLDLEVLMNA